MTITSPIERLALEKREAEQRRAEQLLRLEHAVTRCLAETDNVATALRTIIRTFCESEGWQCGRYFARDAGGANAVVMTQFWHMPEAGLERFIEESRDISYSAGSGLIGRVWQSGQPMWVTDIGNDARINKGIARQAGLHGTFIFPAVAGGEPVGVFSFHSSTIREPEQRLLQAVGVVGSQIGQYLQRKQAEAIMRESEARFRNLTRLSSDVYWEQDEHYRFTSFGGTGSKNADATNLAWIGKKRWEQDYVNMSEAGWAAHIATLDARKPFHDLELARRTVDGSLAWVTITGEPIFDDRGNFKGYRGIGKDITARKREEKLLALEHAVTRSLAEADSALAGVKATLRIVCETEGWECGRYFAPDHEGNLLRYRAGWGVQDTEIERFLALSRGITYATGVGLAGRVWQSGEPLWVADINIDTRVSTAGRAADSRIRGAFVFPLVSEGRRIGVLVFNSRDVREPEQRLLQSIHVIGSQVGQFLQRKTADEKVRNQAQQQRLIAQFGQQALASAKMDEVLGRAAELTATTLRADFSSVLELVPDQRNLIYRATTGWPSEWVGQRIVPVEAGSRLQKILERRQPLVTEDYTAESDYSASPLVQFGVRSGVQVPIFGPAEIYGVLGVHTLQVRHFTDDDVSFLCSVANILAIAIERKNAEDKVAHLAQFDTVTGLPNRHLFRDRLGQALGQAQRNGWLVGMLFVDLDRFKAVNDTYGHGVGDKLLKEVANRLKKCVRAVDTVARISGDEFAVVLSHLARADDASLVSRKAVDSLAGAFELDGHQVYVSASIGIALYPSDGGDPDALVKNADTAMYRAKEEGRNCFRFFLPEMNERLMQRLQVESRLRGSLARGEYRLHYQPKVRLDTGAISGFEALLRWEQEGRLVPPLEFVPILEDTGLVVPVGEWVLRSACEQIAKWSRMDVAPRPVAVNISARQFQRKNLATTVQQILRETRVAPDLLELELTETLLMSDAEEAVEMLRELKGLGVHLSVDDFGTGYSSLAYLRRFPLDTLKIDRTFIQHAVSKPDDATLTLTIINLAHSMRLKVVAEGVETEGQLGFLRMHGCDEIQGYYFARPADAAECTQALIEDRRLQQPLARPDDGLPAVLLVDDDENDLRLMAQALASDDFTILTATGATAGFEVLACHGAEVVIADHRMPGMTGVEFLANVRKLYPKTVRIVATGSDDPPTLTRAVNSAGIQHFLSKNWDPARLRAEVREAYRQRP